MGLRKKPGIHLLQLLWFFGANANLKPMLNWSTIFLTVSDHLSEILVCTRLN